MRVARLKKTRSKGLSGLVWQSVLGWVLVTAQVVWDETPH